MTRLSILMHRDLGTGEWYVDRVEADHNNIRTQTRFGIPYPMRLVFSEEIVEYLQEALPKTTGPSAIVMDEKTFSSVMISFSNLKIIAQRALAGLQSVSIRAQNVAGNLSRIYSPKLMLETNAMHAPQGQLEKQTTSVM